jgi:hypothetical protein
MRCAPLTPFYKCSGNVSARSSPLSAAGLSLTFDLRAQAGGSVFTRKREELFDIVNMFNPTFSPPPAEGLETCDAEGPGYRV